MADINIAKAPKSYAVLPFYAVGSLFFLTLSTLLVFSHQTLLTQFLHPHILAIVHATTLGWVTMVIFGASYQLLPVICERNLFSNILALVSFFGLLSGVILLIIAFWFFLTGFWMITGGTLVVLAAILYFINVTVTAKKCNKHAIQKCFMISAGFWLLVTTVMGLLIAIHLKYPLFNTNQLQLIALHAHVGFAGWFLQLITGVSSKLVPMFLLSRNKPEKYLQLAFLLQNTGLLIFFFAAIVGLWNNIVWIGYLLVIAGVVYWLLYIIAAFKSRIRKPLDFQMRFTFLSLIFLVLALFLLPFIMHSWPMPYIQLYGLLVLMGWLSGIILGQTFKTLPFIVWNYHYKSLNGRVRVPLPKQLYREILVKWNFYFFIAALMLMCAGLLLQVNMLFLVGSIFWLLIAIVFVWNVFDILLHKTKKSDSN
ncbi:hypothetical protein [Hydrotalea sp.]|uniref:hypothetical protein n=1 Tax=Hydrotalea sp. TaxID=2881279 RepID=UPI00261B88D0|nr:hypothetical protein [Hydrotalea sp.]